MISIEGPGGNPTRLLTRREAAAILRLNPQTLAVWASAKRYNLRFYKVGGSVRYSRADIEAFLRTRTRGDGGQDDNAAVIL